MRTKWMRVLSTLIAMLLLSNMFGPFAFAAESPKESIRVGYYEYSGFIEQQENGNYSGYAVQYLNEISKYTGWNYTYVQGHWNDLMEQLKNGEIDLICQAQKSEEREKSYLFSKNACCTEGSVLYTTESNHTLFYNGFEDFDGISVAMLEGSFQNDSLAAFAKKKGFSYIPRFYPTEEEAFAALDAGTVNAVALGSLSIKAGYKVLCRMDNNPFYFITGKQNEEFMDQLNDTMEEILDTNQFFAMDLYHSYFGNKNSSSLNLTKSEIDYIENAGVIQVGQLRNRYVISSIDPQSGKLVGISEDILQLISNKSGLQFQSNPIPLDIKPVEALKAGEFDMVMGILSNDTFRGDQELRLSNNYLESTLTIVMRNGDDYDPSKQYTVALKKSFQAMHEYIAAKYPQYGTKFYSSDEECLEALLDEEVDFCIQNIYTMNYLLQKPKYSDLEMLPTSFLTEEDCIAALSDTDPCLISVIDKAIASISNEEINSIILANTIAKPYHLTTNDFIFKYRLQIFIITFLVVLCFSFMGRSLHIRQKNAKMLEQKNVQLAEAVNQANRASVAKSQFLSRMSHEIRTPMNAIVGLTSIAKQHKGDVNKTEDYLTKIETSSKVLLNIINDVLDMSAIESNKIKIANEEFDIKQILNGITTIYFPQCESKKIHFEMTTDLEDEILRGDGLRISQILLNLVSNAYKFTEENGTIHICAQELTRKDHIAYIRFEVSDTGIGMSMDMQKRLFQPFEQESSSIAKKHGGSGLGLSIARNLVYMMHGAIKVESERGKGTTFTVDLPLEIVNQSEVDHLPKEIRILVVDDDPISLDYTSVVLHRIGVNFDEASSGQQALDMIEQANHLEKPYDVLMLDWRMSDMDGVTLTRHIREREKRNIMIIIVSAYDLNQVEDEAKEAGANYFVSKPLFQSTIFNVLMMLSKGQLHKISPKQMNYDFTGHKILLAEDNEINAEIAKELLEFVHLELEWVSNGERAVELFRQCKPGTFDLILMDVQMPIMDGYEATNAIRSMERADAKTIPIYAMTANAFSEDVAQALNAGMNGHIAKPIDTEVLYCTLDKAIRESGIR